jgi:hypothetical protein
MAESLCAAWSKKWAESMPDPIVADKIEDGMLDPGCLDEERVRRILESETNDLDLEDLDEELREEFVASPSEILDLSLPFVETGFEFDDTVLFLT